MPSVPRRPVLLIVAAGALGLLGPQVAQAQTQAQTQADSVARRDSLARSLAPFAVRATRSTQSSFTAPLAITHIDKSQFAGTSGFGLNDALGNVPGVLVQSRYGTSDVRIAIRGFGARGAGDRSNAGTSRGVRVLLDGMPETEPDGRTSFDNIDLAAAEGHAHAARPGRREQPQRAHGKRALLEDCEHLAPDGAGGADDRNHLSAGL